MQCTYRINDARLLLEANPGELFTTLGPYMTECVLALRSRDDGDGVRTDVPTTAYLNPDAKVPVVVVACRVGAGEPEYYPAGFEVQLVGSTPIVFLEPVAPFALRAKEERGEPPAIQEGGKRLAAGQHYIREPMRCAADTTAPAADDVARPEFFSRI
jgi:hypothetical protein